MPVLAGGVILFPGKQTLNWEGQEMTRRGFSLYLCPTLESQDVYAIVSYIDTYDDGTPVRTETISRNLIEMDGDWVERVPDDQFAFLSMELLSQIMTAGRDPDEVRSFRESIARDLKSSGTLSQEM